MLMMLPLPCPCMTRTSCFMLRITPRTFVILSMKHEVRVMQGQGSGSIINISSTYGHEGAAGASVYVGSKHAVEGITKSVALEIAKSGIRVNGVAPGPTDTGMLTRFTGTPE